MKYRLRVRPKADADVDELALYIARRNLDAALRFHDAFYRTKLVIASHPNRWPRQFTKNPKLAGLRRCAVEGFRNYLVFYRVERNLVDIIRVIYGTRDIESILDRELTDE